MLRSVTNLSIQFFSRFVACLVLVNSFLLSVKWEEEVPQNQVNSTQTEKTEEPYYKATLASYPSGNLTVQMDSDTIRNSLCNASSVLTIFFVIEVIMKMIAFTPYGYWQSRRNRGDLIVTILGVIWIVLDNIIKNHYTLTFGKPLKIRFLRHKPFYNMHTMACHARCWRFLQFSIMKI